MKRVLTYGVVENIALSGPIGTTLGAATSAGGTYQFGTGVGQLIEGDDAWTAVGNMASGALAMSAVRFKPGGTRSTGKGTSGNKLHNSYSEF